MNSLRSGLLTILNLLKAYLEISRFLKRGLTNSSYPALDLMALETFINHSEI